MCLAIPGQVLEIIDERNRLARVEVAGVRRNVSRGTAGGHGRANAGRRLAARVLRRRDGLRQTDAGRG